MITIEKLKEYESFGGSWDMFEIYKVRRNLNVNSGNDWNNIDKLIQDFIIINNGLASDEFARTKENELKGSCDNEDIFNYFLPLTKRMAIKFAFYISSK